MQKQFTDVLADEVQSLFEAGETDTWASVRNLLASKTDVAESELSNAHECKKCGGEKGKKICSYKKSFDAHEG